MPLESPYAQYDLLKDISAGGAAQGLSGLVQAYRGGQTFAAEQQQRQATLEHTRSETAAQESMTQERQLAIQQRQVDLDKMKAESPYWNQEFEDKADILHSKAGIDKVDYQLAATKYSQVLAQQDEDTRNRTVSAGLQTLDQASSSPEAWNAFKQSPSYQGMVQDHPEVANYSYNDPKLHQLMGGMRQALLDARANVGKMGVAETQKEGRVGAAETTGQYRLAGIEMQGKTAIEKANIMSATSTTNNRLRLLSKGQAVPKALLPTTNDVPIAYNMLKGDPDIGKDATPEMATHLAVRVKSLVQESKGSLTADEAYSKAISEMKQENEVGERLGIMDEIKAGYKKVYDTVQSLTGGTPSPPKSAPAKSAAKSTALPAGVDEDHVKSLMTKYGKSREEVVTALAKAKQEGKF